LNSFRSSPPPRREPNGMPASSVTSTSESSLCLSPLVFPLSCTCYSLGQIDVGRCAFSWIQVLMTLRFCIIYWRNANSSLFLFTEYITPNPLELGGMNMLLSNS
jgi:hypothetical protein